MSYIEISEAPSKGKKTRCWEVYTREDSPKDPGGMPDYLGVIQWYGPWRGYAFYPEASTLYEHKCLRDIAEFVERVTREHRAATEGAKVASRETTPPVNLVQRENQRWYNEWTKTMRALRQRRRAGEKAVAFHQRVLGRQSFCWVGGSENRRFYVWDRPLWRIFVHNEAGVGFEVPVDSASVWKALADYKEAMGCTT